MEVKFINMKQDLLGLRDLSADEILNILETAKTMKKHLLAPKKRYIICKARRL